MTDQILAIGIEYEKATIAALKAMKTKQGRDLAEAYVRWNDAMMAIQLMAVDDYNRCLTFVTNRGRIKDEDWRTILAGMERMHADIQARKNPGAPSRS